nr:hypothetical protein [Tanacetum cinerariifolium]
GELITIPPRIINREQEEYISLMERLLYVNSSPRPSKDFHVNPNTIIESLPTFPIPVEDSDPFIKEIDLFLASDGSIPLGIDSDYSNSEGDNPFPKRLLYDDPIPFQTFFTSKMSFEFLFPSSPIRPPDSYHPPHPTYETYSYESCGNDSHFVYDCRPRFLLNYEQEPGYIQNYNSYPHDSPSFPQQYPCCEGCEGPHEPFQYDDEDYTIAITPDFPITESLSMRDEHLSTILTDELIKSSVEKLVQNPNDDEDYTIAITPDFPITESLSMRDEHLSTILTDELIKSSVEKLVQNPSESEDQCECDVPDCYDSQTTNFSKFSN